MGKVSSKKSFEFQQQNFQISRPTTPSKSHISETKNLCRLFDANWKNSSIYGNSLSIKMCRISRWDLINFYVNIVMRLTLF